MFYLTSLKKEMCCGCRACELICPTKCIRMVEDEETFLYPIKDEALCTNCGLCESVCSFINKKKIINKIDDNTVVPSRAYLAIHKDEDTLYKSASGGAFSAVANSFCQENYAVFGVEFTDEFKVIHSHVDSLSLISKYRKSKYVQSDTNICYSKAKELLEKGVHVLFTGTPCQIAGLKLFLKKDYENLLCVDLVCHGVPSQGIFDRYIDYLVNKYRGGLEAYQFREKIKNKNNQWNSRNVKISINGKTRVLNNIKDKYLRGFHSGLYYRPSCYNCIYANSTRVSDITMADFWRVEQLFPLVDVHKGASALIFNTANGYGFKERIDNYMNLTEVDYDDVIIRNGQLRRPANKHQYRERFFKLLEENDFGTAVDKCMPRFLFLRRIVGKVLPYKTKEQIKKIMAMFSELFI